MARKYTTHSAAFKMKVALEAAKNDKPVNQIASEQGVHPAQVSDWKKQLLEGAPLIFTGKQTKKACEAHEDVSYLQQQVGKLTTQLDWLKKKLENAP